MNVRQGVVCAAALLVLATLAAAGVTSEAELKERNDEEVNEKESAAEPQPEFGAPRFGLPKLHNLQFPFLPMIAGGGMSLSLTGVQILGLEEGKFRPHLDGSVSFQTNLLSLVADEYIAGGHMLNLPFVGRSKLTASIEDFKATFSFELENGCVKSNSTTYTLQFGQFVVNFEDLNPYQESGELINAVISDLGEDVETWLNLVLNAGGQYYDIVDKIVVKLLNLRLQSMGGCETNPEPEFTDILNLPFVPQYMNLENLKDFYDEIEEKVLGKHSLLDIN